MLTIILLILVNISDKAGCEQVEDRQVTIVTPKHDGTFQCEILTMNQCFFTMRGTALNLKEGDYLNIFLQVEDGNVWWRAGDPIAYKRDFVYDWSVPMLSIDPNRPFRRFVAIVLIAKEAIPPGKNYAVLPEHFAESPLCHFSLASYSYSIYLMKNH
ncbi:MAG: hypothetical protein WCR46_24790 [Deltaproteobacteria bacterium]